MNNMIEIEVELPESTYLALKQAAEQKHKTESELAADAIRAYLKPVPQVDSLLGLYSDEAELIDAITERAMETRERTPLRLTR